MIEEMRVRGQKALNLVVDLAPGSGFEGSTARIFMVASATREYPSSTQEDLVDQAVYDSWQRDLDYFIAKHRIADRWPSLKEFYHVGFARHVDRIIERQEQTRNTVGRAPGTSFPGVKPGQVAIAWLLHKGPDLVPIPGTKRVKYLEENIAAASIPLDAARMSALDYALAPEKISGPRYSPAAMSMVDR